MLDGLKNFFKDLYTWITSLLEGNPPAKSNLVLHSEKQEFGMVSLLKFDYPGMVDWSASLRKKVSDESLKLPLRGVWVFDSPKSKSLYFVLLLNIAELKTAKGEVKYKSSSQFAWEQQFEKALEKSIAESKTLRCTHIFIDLWVSKEKSSFTKVAGKMVSDYRLTLRNNFVLDLQGFNTINLYTNTQARAVVLEYINCVSTIWKEGVTRSWEEVVNSINITSWLIGAAHHHIADDHHIFRNRVNLPRRPRH